LIHEAIYDYSTLDKVKLRAYAVVEKLEIIEENIGIISLSNEELRRFHYQKGDTEGLVNVILSVEGINVAVLAMEKEDGIKISFRSKGEYFVNDFAQKYFQGGGHKYAAGGFSSASIQETLEEIKKNCIAYF
jgi:phosphoesterase RecJ-like protein